MPPSIFSPATEEPASANNHRIRHGWVFRGNVVVPTGNPFLCPPPPPPPTKEDLERCLWLGPGLQILLDHVVTVNSHGIVTEVRAATPSDVAPATRELEASDGADSLTSTASTAATFVQLDEQHEFLCPGMIDLHIHAPQYSYTGTATDRPLMGPTGWLETYTFPAEARLGNDLVQAQRVYDAVVRRTLATGTTTAVYFATLHVEPCQVLVDTVVRYGQRALIGKVCMDRNSPDIYCQSLQENIQGAKDVIEYIYQTCGKRPPRRGKQNSLGNHDSQQVVLPLVLPLITPRFIPTCTPDLLSALGDLAADHDCHITSHISESIDEVAFSRYLDSTVDGGSGRTDAVIFDSHKLLTDQCIMAHGVFLTDEPDDLDLMQRRGAAVAHCPLSNYFFAGGVLPCRQLMERGVKVGLGTDAAGGYSPSMLHSSRMAVIASQTRRQQHQQAANGDIKTDSKHELDYRHAFYLATLGGAEALGLQDRIGTLAVGMEFDAMILSAAESSHHHPIDVFDSDSLDDVFQKLCVLGDDRNVKRVFVQGREVTIRPWNS